MKNQLAVKVTGLSFVNSPSGMMADKIVTTDSNVCKYIDIKATDTGYNRVDINKYLIVEKIDGDWKVIDVKTTKPKLTYFGVFNRMYETAVLNVSVMLSMAGFKGLSNKLLNSIKN